MELLILMGDLLQEEGEMILMMDGVGAMEEGDKGEDL